MPDVVAHLRDALGPYLSERRAVATTVASARRMTVGHSRAMYRIDTGDGERFVVRVEQGGVFGTSGRDEFALMAALHDADFPVARVLWHEDDPSILGQPFFVMDFIDAAAISAGHDERAVDRATCEAFVLTLSRLHRLELAAPFASTPTDPSAATHVQIDRWAEVYRSAVDHPIGLLEEAAAWLHHHAPPLDRLSVVHGDAGPGNFVHAGGRVVAVTDWEFAHLGDPAEDWSFCLAMRGRRTMSRDDWLDVFSRTAGVVMTPELWHYWEAFNLFKGACANCTCLALFERGTNRAPNMAIIGTTLHQTFLRRLADLVVPPTQTHR